MNVVAPRAHDRRRCPERQIDPVLRAHDAEVRAEVALAVAPGRNRRSLSKTVGIRAGPNNGDPAGRNVPRRIAVSRYDSFVATT